MGKMIKSLTDMKVAFGKSIAPFASYREEKILINNKYFLTNSISGNILIIDK